MHPHFMTVSKHRHFEGFEVSQDPVWKRVSGNRNLLAVATREEGYTNTLTPLSMKADSPKLAERFAIMPTHTRFMNKSNRANCTKISFFDRSFLSTLVKLLSPAGC